MSKKIVLFLAIFMFAFSSNVFAQDTTITPTTQPTEAAQPTTVVTPSPSYKAQLETIKQEKSTIRTTAKETNLQVMDAMKAKMATFKTQIANIKDARKKTLAEKISNSLTDRNTAITGRMTDTLTRMTSIIARLKERSAALKTAGKDTVGLDGAIAAAETAVTNAQTTVTAQSQKTYAGTITTDATVRSAMTQLFLQFKTDILASYQAMTNARLAIVKAAGEVGKISGEKTATSAAALQQ